MKRGVSNHALQRIHQRMGKTLREKFGRMPTAKDVKSWINSEVPAGEGRIVHDGLVLVFSPATPSGKQDLITMWRAA